MRHPYYLCLWVRDKKFLYLFKIYHIYNRGNCKKIWYIRLRTIQNLFYFLHFHYFKCFHNMEKYSKWDDLLLFYIICYIEFIIFIRLILYIILKLSCILNNSFQRAKSTHFEYFSISLRDFFIYLFLAYVLLLIIIGLLFIGISK